MTLYVFVLLFPKAFKSIVTYTLVILSIALFSPYMSTEYVFEPLMVTDEIDFPATRLPVVNTLIGTVVL